MYWVVDTSPTWIFYPTPAIRRNLDIITADFEPMPLEEKTSVQTTPDYSTISPQKRPVGIILFHGL